MMRRITIRVPADLVEALGREARRRRESVSGVVRQALRVHLTRARRPDIVSLGRSGHAHTARDAGSIITEGWAHTGCSGRTLGQDAGRFEVPEDFDEPLPDDILGSFHR